MLYKTAAEGVSVHSGVFYSKECDLGLGLFAARNIPKGEIIYKFSGKTITYADTIRRSDKEECKALQFGEDQYLDLELPGVLINHSCDPNCGIVDDFYLIARRDISKDEQLMYDYSTTMDDGYTMECRCGSRNCRGVVEDFKRIGLENQLRYMEEGIVMSYLMAKFSLGRS